MPKQQELKLTLTATLTLTDGGRVKAGDMEEFLQQLNSFFLEEWDQSEHCVEHPDGESDELNLQLDVINVAVDA
ncbi:hypothetical protein ACIGXM_14075 [Kitasatospora sp. NPDC052896]|uniref:hypothetical protein n=1 Tax=Kitasatospora sp. NPDC052896 TaxID=3364061 RepID=UPI0037C95CA5